MLYFSLHQAGEAACAEATLHKNVESNKDVLFLSLCCGLDEVGEVTCAEATLQNQAGRLARMPVLHGAYIILMQADLVGTGMCEAQ